LIDARTGSALITVLYGRHEQQLLQAESTILVGRFEYTLIEVLF
jgi:hypothetical protein